jgi:hypothetical protein
MVVEVTTDLPVAGSPEGCPLSGDTDAVWLTTTAGTVLLDEDTADAVLAALADVTARIAADRDQQTALMRAARARGASLREIGRVASMTHPGVTKRLGNPKNEEWGTR